MLYMRNLHIASLCKPFVAAVWHDTRRLKDWKLYAHVTLSSAVPPVRPRLMTEYDAALVISYI